MEQQKTVLLGVTGCIAAYKACEILRLLQKAGVRVRVVMTEAATKFVGPSTFEGLTHERVLSSFFGEGDDPIPHINLAHEADLFLIAPCTANTLAKLAMGVADNLLTSAALACTAPVMVAPAANVNMYCHPATQANIQTLRDRGVKVIEADSGYLACGDEGKGRLAEPQEIVDEVLRQLGVAKGDMQGMKVMITAGPTIEPIDPVRYITNFSSGKTGYSLANAAARRGADVTIVSGPVAVDAPVGVKVVRVQTAQQMFEASEREFPNADIHLRCGSGGHASGRLRSQQAEEASGCRSPESDQACRKPRHHRNPCFGQDQTDGCGFCGRNPGRDRECPHQAGGEECRFDHRQSGGKRPRLRNRWKRDMAGREGRDRTCALHDETRACEHCSG